MILSYQHIYMLRKLLLAFVCVALFVSLVSSCSSKKEPAEEQLNDTELAAEEAEEVAEVVEKPKLHFASPEDAMQYMDESENHEA